jgi:hypothetical protein
MFVLCVVSTDKEAKRRPIKTENQVRTKCRVQENTKKKNHEEALMFVLCIASIDKKKKVRKKYKEITRERLQKREKKKSRWWRNFALVQTGPGAHPASNKMGGGSLFLGR